MDIVLWHRILSPYEMAVDELILKFHHMKDEYRRYGKYCPIEQVTGRVKSISSILDKMQKKNIPMNRMEEDVEDIAGVRIICQFVEDIDRVASMISRRSDIEVTEIKDYIRNQKQSGYRSYHMIVKYEVNTIDGPKKVNVEIQIRTMAMDFWATTEHSLQYKYQGKIPERVGARLSNAADAIISLDSEMSAVREEIMDAQLSSKMKYSLVEDIVSTIENLYSLMSHREVEKIQDEFYRVYQQDNMEELIRYHDQLDLIAQAYKAQSNKMDEGVKKRED
ncbi:MAG: GTP pyrophosphokinase family protein [Eubacteriales bacterium]|jgi:putative GTP pyrophosphokinase